MCINVLGQTAYGGNMALKLDIIKAFDTLEWPFLHKVLKSFGFDGRFIYWIQFILVSAIILSFLWNDSPHGYIQCERG